MIQRDKITIEKAYFIFWKISSQIRSNSFQLPLYSSGPICSSRTHTTMAWKVSSFLLSVCVRSSVSIMVDRSARFTRGLRVNMPRPCQQTGRIDGFARRLLRPVDPIFSLHVEATMVERDWGGRGLFNDQRLRTLGDFVHTWCLGIFSSARFNSLKSYHCVVVDISNKQQLNYWNFGCLILFCVCYSLRSSIVKNILQFCINFQLVFSI